MRQIPYWDSGFESRQVYGCLCHVNIMCCQVEVFAKDWALRPEASYRGSICHGGWSCTTL